MPRDDRRARDEDGNVPFTPRPRHEPKIDRARNEREIRAYFEARRAKLDVVTTTRTAHGQVIDWVRPEARIGGPLSAPPPPLEMQPDVGRDLRQVDSFVRSALELDNAEHGPTGTVPVVRKNLDQLGYRRDLKRFLSKTHGHRVLNDRGQPFARPEEDGSHRYASSGQSTTAFGAEGDFSCFDPWLESEDDFSLVQLGLSNSDLGFLQTAEAGWQEFRDLYGDWYPHLFVYYTTNGYTNDDDDVGGYNTDVDGWVQKDDRICPEITFEPYSVRGGAQYKMSLKYELYQGNWWLACQGRWVGYYPAKLYMGNQSVFSTLGDHADHVGFWGEIFDSDDVAGRTKTDMGSGSWPSAGWPSSAYVHNMRYQSTRSGTKTNYDGSGGIFESDPGMYAIEAHFNSGTSWGSYFYLGGPGAG